MAQLPPKIPNMTPSWCDLSNSRHHNLPSAATFSRDLVGAIATDAVVADQQQHQQNPSWVDEFMDFSSARRGAHRRSVSDSIAFLEAPIILDDCRVNSGNVRPRVGADHDHENEFDRFDDEHFMSMFGDELSGAAMPPGAISSSNPSSPSDHYSINDEKEFTNQQQQHQNLQKENVDQNQQHKQQQLLTDKFDEVESQLCKQETQAPNKTLTISFSSDKITDPKRVKR